MQLSRALCRVWCRLLRPAVRPLVPHKFNRVSSWGASVRHSAKAAATKDLNPRVLRQPITRHEIVLSSLSVCTINSFRITIPPQAAEKIGSRIHILFIKR